MLPWSGLRGSGKVLFAVVRCSDCQLFASVEMYGGLLEEWCADDVLVGARAYRIESECGEHIPCGSLAVVLVSAVAVRLGCIELVHHFADVLLGFPRLSSPVVEIYHVLDRLVSVRVVAHVHHLHLADFVDGESVVAVVEYRRYVEYFVKVAAEILFASHHFHEACRVMEYRPCVVEAVAFCEVTAPFERAERCGEAAVFIASAHEMVFCAVEVSPVHCPVPVWLQFCVALAQGLAESVDAPVVVCVLKGAGRTFVDAHIARHISELVVVFPSEAAG